MPKNKTVAKLRKIKVVAPVRQKHPILCTRCEHRARYLEDLVGPRSECSDGKTSCCYMYSPVVPLAVRALPGEVRPVGGAWALSARVMASEVQPSFELSGQVRGKDFIFYHIPKVSP